MRIRRGRREDAVALARRILPEVEAAEGRGEPVTLVGLPPCTLGRPFRGLRLESDPGPRRRLALCAVCDDESVCPGFRPDDPGARLSRQIRPRIRPQRDLARQARFFAFLRARERLPADPLVEIESTLLERLGSREWGAGTPLEFSVAWREGHPYLYRFSCSLPDADHGDIETDLDFVETLLGLVPGIVPGIEGTAWRALRAEGARKARVLFGLEAAAGLILRAKVYVAYRRGPHMIGLDLHTDGRTARKVYLRHETEGGPADVVHIEAPPGERKATDTSLLRNDLGMPHVEAHARRHGGPDLEPLLAIRAEHPVVPTRLSISARDPRDLAVYYWVVPPADPTRERKRLGGLG